MKTNHWALALSLAAVTLASAAKADQGYFATANMAQVSCGADQVVFIDLDRGRYYKKAAHAKYREGKSEPVTVAKQ